MRFDEAVCSQHDGLPPQTYSDKKAFKELISNERRKIDEENFEEAEAQAYRSWTETKVPSEVVELFDDPKLQTLNASCMHQLSMPFFFETPRILTNSYSSTLLPSPCCSQEVRRPTTPHVAPLKHAPRHESQHRCLYWFTEALQRPGRTREGYL